MVKTVVPCAMSAPWTPSAPSAPSAPFAIVNQLSSASCSTICAFVCSVVGHDSHASSTIMPRSTSPPPSCFCVSPTASAADLSARSYAGSAARASLFVEPTRATSTSPRATSAPPPEVARRATHGAMASPAPPPAAAGVARAPWRAAGAFVARRTWTRARNFVVAPNARDAEDVADALAAFLAEEAQAKPWRVMVGVAGAPGSGKSTLAQAVCRAANERGVVCAVISMDGFHHTTRWLDTLPEPSVAHARRGAHWTFDAEAFADTVQDVADAYERAEDVDVPTFDHAAGEPLPSGAIVPAEAQLVIVEGLYLYLDDATRKRVGEVDHEAGVDAAVSGAWARAAQCLRHKLFLQADVGECMRRVRQRHVEAWAADGAGAVKRTIEEIDERVENNDARNARLVAATAEAQGVVVVPSLPLRPRRAG